MSIKRLRDLIFGRRTEKRKTGSVSQPEDKPEEGAGADPGAEREASEKSQRQRQAGPQGHGRRATAQYRGAKKVECWHEQYQAGAKCPEAACPGRLYDTRRPNLCEVSVSGILLANSAKLLRAPEGRRILAGGGARAQPPGQTKRDFCVPAGTPDQNSRQK